MSSHGFAAAILMTAVAARYEPIGFPAKCTAGSYFDISALSCLPCPPTQEADHAGTSCMCAGGRVLAGSVCVWCNASGLAPSADGTACMPCVPTNLTGGTCSVDSTLGFDSASKECTCPVGKVLQDRDSFGGLLETKRCRPCPPGTYKTSMTRCTRCPEAHMVAATPASSTGITPGCTCDTSGGYRAINHASGWWGRNLTCVATAQYNQLSNFDTLDAYRIEYRELPGPAVTVDESKILQQLLLPSAVKCLIAVTASPLSPYTISILEGNQACQVRRAAEKCTMESLLGMDPSRCREAPHFQPRTFESARAFPQHLFPQPSSPADLHPVALCRRLVTSASCSIMTSHQLLVVCIATFRRVPRPHQLPQALSTVAQQFPHLGRTRSGGRGFRVYFIQTAVFLPCPRHPLNCPQTLRSLLR